MDKIERRRDLPVLISFFLVLGSNVMMIIFCALIGFGIHEVLGKIALYISFAFQAINLLIISLRRRCITKGLKVPHPVSKKMRRFHGIVLALWIAGAVSLLFSLACNIFFLSSAEPLVMYSCLAGAIVTPIGWLGVQASYHRRRQETLLSQPA